MSLKEIRESLVNSDHFRFTTKRNSHGEAFYKTAVLHLCSKSLKVSGEEAYFQVTEVNYT